MSSQAYSAYLETNVEAAGPVERVRILYRAALSAVRQAAGHLANGNIRARADAISRAQGIVCELIASLDLAGGGEVAANLVRVYDYIQRRLIDANANQDGAALQETVVLLETLLDAWNQISDHTSPAPPASMFVQSEAAHYSLGCTA